MTDLFGVKLNIGDEIIYTTGAQSNSSLERGFINDIQLKKAYYNNVMIEKAMITMSSGRKAINWRSSNELVSINSIKQLHPELFIWKLIY